MTAAILCASIVVLLAAVVTSVRMVRTMSLGLPWLLLSAALVLMTLRRVAVLAWAEISGDLDDVLLELAALTVAVLLLLAVQAQRRTVGEAIQLRHDGAAAAEVHETLLANLPMAVTVVAQDDSLRFPNPAQMRALTGSDPPSRETLADWLGRAHPDDRAEIESAVARVRAGSAARLAYRYRRADGSWRWAGTVMYPGRSGDVNVLISDITERHELEERLRQVQKMEALGVMGSGLAHDFNNVLASILGNVELALRRLDPGQPARAKLQDAARAALRASEHTRQLLAFSRREVPNPRAVSLGSVCEEAVALVRPTLDPRIEFELRTDGPAWETRGDPGELVQILVNLFLNARDAMPAGGKILVETTNVTLDDTYARVHPDGRAGEHVRLDVTDTGLGMSPEVLVRVFEPFFTTKGPGRGTGLGLAMVYGTVRRHGGWIHCYSEPGRGTRFSIYLPRAAAGLLPAPPREDGDILPVGSETVLLVDDDDDLREVGIESLRELGYSVLSARDGLEALEVYRAHLGRIQLVVLDLSMPRMDGRDTLVRLREIDPEVRVLLTSGHAADGDTAGLVDQAVAGFMSKPYRLADMARAVRAALSGGR